MTRKFTSRKERVRAALLMHHGIGRQEALSVPEIADRLGVCEATVKGYLQESPGMGDRLEDVAEKELRVMIHDLRERLNRLRAIEEQLYDAVEVTVTEYSTQEISGTLDAYRQDNYVIEDVDQELSQEVPVPIEWKEIPQFNRLERVWEEQRKTQDQLVQLLGLKEPEEIEVSGELLERKVWQLGTDDDPLPEQEVEAIDVQDTKELDD